MTGLYYIGDTCRGLHWSINFIKRSTDCIGAYETSNAHAISCNTGDVNMSDPRQQQTYKKAIERSYLCEALTETDCCNCYFVEQVFFSNVTSFIYVLV